MKITGQPLEHWLDALPKDVKTESNFSTITNSANVSLLCVCKSINGEATPILYGNNTFSFCGAYRWSHFLGFTEMSSRGLYTFVRKLRVSFPHPYHYPETVKQSLHIIDNLPGLVELEFVIDPSTRLDYERRIAGFGG